MIVADFYLIFVWPLSINDLAGIAVLVAKS